MRRPRHLLAALLAAGLFLPGCSEKLSRQTGLSDRDLLAGGERHVAARKHGKAVEHFRTLLERYPNSPLSSRAQIGLADSHMALEEDAEAEVAFDDFLRLYPSSDNVPYVLYRKGELFFRQVRDPRRDQSKTREAIAVYSRILERGDTGTYADLAAARIRDLRDRLARHEAHVVTHYLARKRFDSAEARARRAIAEYPDSKTLPLLLSLLADSLEKGKKPAEASEVRKSLGEKYPDFKQRGAR